MHSYTEVRICYNLDKMKQILQNKSQNHTYIVIPYHRKMNYRLDIFYIKCFCPSLSPKRFKIFA